MRKHRLLFLLAICGGLLAGCAAAPGLNVEQGQEGVYVLGASQKGKSPDWPPYAQAKVPPPPSAVPETAQGPIAKYEVVRVTPRVVAALAQRQAVPAADAAKELPAVSPADVPPEYRIGPGDVLFVTVWEHPELTQPIPNGQRDEAREGRLVAADGSMYFPYVGRFHVAGMTSAEAAGFISEKLVRAVVDPKVDVRVVSYRAYRVQVTGEVKSPGTVTLDDTPKGILQAIDASGGLTPEASRRRAVLVRNGRNYPIDLANLVSGDNPARNLMVEPGDEIHIPNRAGDKVFVLGEVSQQQPVVMEQTTMPLVEALTTSGGLAKLRADDSGVLVFRVNPAGSEVGASVFVLDMASPDGVLLASAFPLQARDIVYVKTTAFRQYNDVIETILPTVQTIFYADRITD